MKSLVYSSSLLRHLRYSNLFEKILNWNWGSKNCRWLTDIPLKWTHCIFAIFSLVQEKKSTHTVNEILAYGGRERTTSSLSLLIQLSLCFMSVWGKWAVIVEEWQFSDKLYASPVRCHRLYLSQHHYLYWQPLCLWRKHFIVLFCFSQDGRTEKWVSTIKWSFMLTMDTMYVHTSAMILQWLVYRDEKVLGRLESEMKI